jgi:hypothetical protein
VVRFVGEALNRCFDAFRVSSEKPTSPFTTRETVAGDTLACLRHRGW